MALPSTIYRVNLQISDIDRGIYETLQASVARHPSETEERLVARLLAYSVFFEPDLAFTKGISAGDEPDLWLKGPDGRVLLWVEVGLPEPERLVKAGRHAERVALVACGKALPVWEQQQFPKLSGISNLSLITFEPAFINRLAAKLERSISWSITITDGTLYLTAGDETLETVFTMRTGNR
ncbi:MAG TPA: YaeQ family protein [Negativicutes bacterium]|jgi:uncharacterized protein YaeQ